MVGVQFENREPRGEGEAVKSTGPNKLRVKGGGPLDEANGWKGEVRGGGDQLSYNTRSSFH